jgi:VWFA-related protein
MAFERLMTVTRPQDQFFVADFPNSPLNEAVYQSIQSLQERGKEHRRALLLFTTKQDPGAYPFSKVASLLKDSDVQLYVVAFSPTANSEILRELAASSGGESFFPPSMISLPGIFSRIRTGVGNGYVIGYRSTNAATDGKWRKVKVTAELPDRRSTRNLSVRSKAGYYAPGIASR